MKRFIKISKPSLVLLFVLAVWGCTDKLDEPELNNNFAGGTDFTDSSGMLLSTVGAYEAFYSRGWEQPLIISVRGDDVNSGGLGDQPEFTEMDKFNYSKDHWMVNSLWENTYADVISAHTAMEQIARYQEFGSDEEIALGNQYIAEIQVLRGMMLFQISQVYGDVFIPESSDTELLLEVETLPTKAEVMQHVSDQMDLAIPLLPEMRPNERTDLKGGVTKYTALAIKALANQELENYQAVADATGQIIASGKFSLYPDFYELFKTPGKLSDESILDLQYSDFNQGEGDRFAHLYAPYGSVNWTPAVEGAASGWGFYEPSFKFIKFMLDRGETVRLETSVLFTDRGIAELQTDAAYSDLPSFMTNVTRDGDKINDFSRGYFSSGKHYLPSNQLIAGRTAYGSNKNYNVIRYAEILLMYAEALKQGASSSVMTADQAVNLVRERAGMPALSGVTLDQIVDEKFAELAMEWGKRYYDMLRLKKYDELSYDGRTFTEDKKYLPYPQPQIDQFPVLDN
ncbi:MULTISPECIES: RagB/SusD family nutrient uptake outer membrane protein [Zobellia]|uniref:SusD/RagB family lipoprotein n=1 Tax=Zobellia galactanivorans (strain DSM 12802 / CCUG 47099 / CIP 106680 / NCIMB 13871 / Dsij) TaxID=63186 RepID=G0L1X1_ZOBGA|nr:MULTISPECIES: RagB/SusD family nutrient uptake outer membrane protein [Zobellia]MBU3024457.1 RagB/SusD family nutrient uptake outer membrane protein [Zobellia galactanivorans]OWW23450.1 RagB/SusD family nutrient uptake outer membrane protein [Zobellia sp. OII3]CAZ97952.1 SusD/RagB family lipoprotein [Zobellia galactanivorans]